MNRFDVKDFNIITLNVGFAQHNGDWNWQDVRSPFARMYYVTEGNAQVVIRRGLKDGISTSYDLRPGHMYLIPPFTFHSYVCSGKFNHYYIHIYEESADKVNILNETEFPVEVDAMEGDLHMFERLTQLMPYLQLKASNPDTYDNHSTLINNLNRNHQRDFYERVESRGILNVLMSRFLANAHLKMKISDDRIKNSIEFLRGNIDKSIRIEALAKEACMSRDHFIRKFKEQTGKTPTAYINMRKIEMAEQLLVTTDLNIKAISDRLGFTDCPYFNRVFSKLAGMSPYKYRRRMGM